MVGVVANPLIARFYKFFSIGILSVITMVIPLTAMAASKDISVQVCSPNASLSIVNPAGDVGTMDKSIIVSGYGAADVSVSAYRNSKNVGIVTTGSDGSYSISIPLVVGVNSIHTRVTNDCGESSDSNIVTVTREMSPEPPQKNEPSKPSVEPPTGNPPPRTATSPDSLPDKITAPAPGSAAGQKVPTILEPNDGFATDSPTILLKGVAEPGVRLWIERNGQRLAEIVADDEGRFAVTIPLVAGENMLVVIREAKQGDIRSKAVTVTYYPKTLPPGTSRSEPLLPPAAYVAVPVVIAAVSGLLIGRHHHKWQLRKRAQAKGIEKGD